MNIISNYLQFTYGNEYLSLNYKYFSAVKIWCCYSNLFLPSFFVHLLTCYGYVCLYTLVLVNPLTLFQIWFIYRQHNYLQCLMNSIVPLCTYEMFYQIVSYIEFLQYPCTSNTNITYWNPRMFHFVTSFYFQTNWFCYTKKLIIEMRYVLK
jgi:hypothetical protein